MSAAVSRSDDVKLMHAGLIREWWEMAYILEAWKLRYEVCRSCSGLHCLTMHALSCSTGIAWEICADHTHLRIFSSETDFSWRRWKKISALTCVSWFRRRAWFQGGFLYWVWASIPLLGHVGPQNITVGVWEFNLDLSLPAQSWIQFKIKL